MTKTETLIRWSEAQETNEYTNHLTILLEWENHEKAFLDDDASLIENVNMRIPDSGNLMIIIGTLIRWSESRD